MRREANLLHELPLVAAERDPDAVALIVDERPVRYRELAGEVARFANALASLGVQRQERVAIYLDKRLETVVASFGAPAHGAVFVPINPLLKAEQVAYILRDCGVRVLVTNRERPVRGRRSTPGAGRSKHRRRPAIA
jgi:acyl-CoA synthetase (AMP-forming)/AMP-acid ligase II